MTPTRPLAVAFDVVETLFSLHPVRSALDEAGAGPRGLELFFTRLLRDGFALARRRRRAFSDVASADAGLDRHVEDVVSVEESGRWKPAAPAYHHRARSLGIEAAALALVTMHSWDAHGAHRAGLVTGWASRLEGSFPDIFAPPQVSGRNW